MKRSRKAEIAVIGGTGLESLLKEKRQVRVGTPYGIPPLISVGRIAGKDVAFLPRHGEHHSVPPHRVNYHANIYALNEIGVKRVIATNAVGAVNLDFKPGDLVVPHDFVDFTKLRQSTFYDYAPVTHVDMSQPYCPEIRGLLIKNARESDARVLDKAVLACTEGPRYETPAEIEMFRRLGCDVVGMTGVPEAVLARELELCYAPLCYVSNMAAGVKQRLTALEVREMAKQVRPIVEKVLMKTIKDLSGSRRCPCARALEGSRL